MRSFIRAGLPLLSGLFLSTTSVDAQRVSADVVVREGPVVAHVSVGDPRLHRPRRAVIVERHYRPMPRVLVVERYRVPRGRAHGWWRNHGYHRAYVWVDSYGRYYDRYDDRIDGLREIRVYVRAGRYYRWDDDYRYERRVDRRADRGDRGDDRYEDRDDDRHEDRDRDRDRRPDRDRDGK
jgi:hypothetical protein